MQEIPPPPECAGCGSAIGLWEKIIINNVSTREPTTWLRVVEDGTRVGPVWHLDCVPDGNQC